MKNKLIVALITCLCVLFMLIVHLCVYCNLCVKISDFHLKLFKNVFCLFASRSIVACSQKILQRGHLKMTGA